MVIDDRQACLQAYQFAELVLAGAHTKSEKEREQAVEAARRLHEEVRPRFEAAMSGAAYSVEQLRTLRESRSRLEEKLERWIGLDGGR
jgi:hypothetical protein